MHVHAILVFFEGTILIGLSVMIWDIGHSPIEQPLWAPYGKDEKLWYVNYGPPYHSIHRWEFNHMRTKWSPILNVLGINLGTCGTLDVRVIQWEHDGKTLGTREKYENMSLAQRESWTHHIYACWAFLLYHETLYFHNCSLPPTSHLCYPIITHIHDIKYKNLVIVQLRPSFIL